MKLLRPIPAYWPLIFVLAGTRGYLLQMNAAFGQTQPAASSVERIEAELDANSQLMRETMGPPGAILDPAKRAAIAPKLIPILARLTRNLEELEKADPSMKEQVAPAKRHYLMMSALLGDKASADRLQEMANSNDPAQSLFGKSLQLLVRWYASAMDPLAQKKVVDDVEALAKGHPESEELTQQIVSMSETGAASPELGIRLEDLVSGVMKNAVAAGAKDDLIAAQKLRSLKDKPLVFSSKLLDGKPFSTADWNGKVILVDFWATWCPPCVEEIPLLEKLYKEDHAKGLELIGVSSDYTAADIKKFLDEKKEMVWPQLYDAATAENQELNPIASGLGIRQIPTLFVIDKKGVLRAIIRSLNPEPELESLIPKLLAE